MTLIRAVPKLYNAEGGGDTGQLRRFPSPTENSEDEAKPNHIIGHGGNTAESAANEREGVKAGRLEGGEFMLVGV